MKEPKSPIGRMWSLYKMGGLTPAIASMLGAQNAQQMAFLRSVAKGHRKESLLEARLLDLDTVVFDLETTGFYPSNGDEIISFGAVVVQGGNVREDLTFHSLVNPKRKIPQAVVELTGITNEMAETAPDLIETLHRFFDFVGRRILIAHASGHDKQFLNAALWKTSKVNLNHRVVDTLMVEKWLEPRRTSYTLDDLLESYGVPKGIRHHALEDALMTAKLWVRMLDRILQRNIITLGDLYAYLSR